MGITEGLNNSTFPRLLSKEMGFKFTKMEVDQGASA
jgi:hypothetical protein